MGSNGKASAQVKAITAPTEAVGRKSGSHGAVKGKTTGKNRVVVDKHFEDHEQAFFDQEHQLAAESHAPGPESFADLDEGRPKPTFWQRLFGRPTKKRRKVRKTGTRSAAGKQKK